MQPVNGTGPGPPLPAGGLVVSEEQQSSVKQRKPYNLQKAREKWTDEEHNKFVEGLRLHGRQWRKIEGQYHCCCPTHMNPPQPAPAVQEPAAASSFRRQVCMYLTRIALLPACRAHGHKDSCADQVTCTKVLLEADKGDCC